MQVDIIWVRKNFRSFNSQYFDGILPEPVFHVGRSKSRLGYLAYKRGLTWRNVPHTFGRGGGNAFTLGLSNYYDLPEREFQNVLLHEMIHLSIAVSGVRDSSPHGVIFRGMMARLNRAGWHIQVMTNISDYKKAYTGSENIIKTYLVLALEMRDGKHFLSSVNPKFAGQLNSRLKAVRDIKSYGWYTTNDRFFEDMPKVRSLRGRPVNLSLYDSKVASMTPIKL